MDYSTPGSLLHHYLPEVAQIHVHGVGDVIYLILCCPLLLLPSVFPIRVFSRFFTSGGQSSGASASASFPPMNIQGWSPLGLTGLISLQSKGLSRVLSKTTVWKKQFFSAQPSLGSSSHSHTWLLEKPKLWLYRPLSAKWYVLFNILSRFVIGFLPRKGANVF